MGLYPIHVSKPYVSSVGWITRFCWQFLSIVWSLKFAVWLLPSWCRWSSPTDFVRFLVTDNSYRRRLNGLTNGLLCCSYCCGLPLHFLLLGEFRMVWWNLILYALVSQFQPTIKCVFAKDRWKKRDLPYDFVDFFLFIWWTIVKNHHMRTSQSFGL